MTLNNLFRDAADNLRQLAQDAADSNEGAVDVRKPDNSSHEFEGPVWACSICDHEEGEYGAHFYRYCPKCGSKIVKAH